MNDNEKPLYVVYRIYPRGSFKNYQHAWTHNKHLAKMLLMQRTPGKFKVVKTTLDDLGRIYSENGLERDTELKLRNVLSTKVGRTVPLAITDQEVSEARAKLRRIFSKLCSPVGRTGPYSLDEQIRLYEKLDPMLLEILEYLGFRPPEMNIIFDSVEEDPSVEEDGSYYLPGSNLYSSPGDHTPPWLQCLCSLEGLILALKENF